MSKKTLINSAGSMLLFAAILHIGRVAVGLELILGGFLIPIWISLVVGFAAGYLSWTAFTIED